MSVRTALVALTATVALAAAGCADDPRPHTAAARAPVAAATPLHDARLTAEDEAVWRTPRRTPGRIPVLLYHGVAERDGRVAAVAGTRR